MQITAAEPFAGAQSQSAQRSVVRFVDGRWRLDGPSQFGRVDPHLVDVVVRVVRLVESGQVVVAVVKSLSVTPQRLHQTVGPVAEGAVRQVP